MPLVDEPAVVEADEALLDGLGQAGVHGEALALPVAAAPERAELPDDLAAVLLLPGPDALQEALAPQVVARQVLLLAQRRLDLRLGGDAGVVGARQPAAVAAAQLLKPDQDVLKRVVQHMAHRQLARDVRRRYHNRVRRLPLHGRVARVEVPTALPGRIPLLLHFRRIVGLRHHLLFRHLLLCFRHDLFFLLWLMLVSAA